VNAADVDLAIQRAWPPRATGVIGPWRARLDGGVTRRPNSVLPHGTGPEPGDGGLDEMLAEVMRLYEAHGLTPWIQVTEAAWPPRLEERLAERGWETGIDRTLLLAGPVVSADGAAFVEHSPSQEWVATWWGVDPRGGDSELTTCLELLERIEEGAFARVVNGCHTHGVGLGVRVEDTLVLECVATVPAARRQGVATRVVSALGAWGRGRGATRALLAVQERNVAARRLYERLGFATVGSYATRARA
jgi:GNAT superfamily N-acetyltransferase